MIRLSGHARGHGSHRRVLEAGLGGAGRRLRAPPGQCSACQDRARAQNRRERRGLARRLARARAHSAQLRPAARGAGAARPHPHAQAAHPRAGVPRPAHRQGPTRGQPQAWLGALQYYGPQRASHLGCAGRRREHPGDARRLVTRNVRASRAQVTEALHGRLAEHQRLLLRVHLGQIDAIEAAIAALDRELSGRLEPFREAVTRLSATPGLSALSVAGILAEIGLDMSPFPSEAHLISWAGLCPRNDESAGKRRSTRLRPGTPWLKTLLVQAAWCGVRTKGSYFRALFLRLKARRGPKKAIVAVARAILTAVYVMLRRGVDYHDLGPDHFQRTERTRLANRLAQRLDELGFEVTFTERAAA